MENDLRACVLYIFSLVASLLAAERKYLSIKTGRCAWFAGDMRNAGASILAATGPSLRCGRSVLPMIHWIIGLFASLTTAPHA